VMRDLATRFSGILSSRNLNALDKWIDDAIETVLTAIMRFASALRRDIDAVKTQLRSLGATVKPEARSIA